MGVVTLFALTFAAATNPLPAVAGASIATSMVTVFVSIVGAKFCRGARRAFSRGYLAFAGGFLLMAYGFCLSPLANEYPLHVANAVFAVYFGLIGACLTRYLASSPTDELEYPAAPLRPTEWVDCEPARRATFAGITPPETPHPPAATTR
jgi:hypothetical protein